VFMDNPEGFHSAVLYSLRKYLSNKNEDVMQKLPEGLIIPPRLGTGGQSAESAPNVR
jgi:hypothetical protein